MRPQQCVWLAVFPGGFDRSNPTTVGALAEALVLDPGALAHTLKPLEREGFIAAAVDPTTGGTG